jgi:hypothetical protein
MLTCPFESTQFAVDVLARLPGGEVTGNWTAWKSLGQPAGYLEKHRKFSFATVKAAGHEAPGYVPVSSFDLVTAFIAGKADELLMTDADISATPAKLSQGSILRAAVAKTRALQRGA